ncbi:hypothetical protein ACFXDP_30845, partial [Streptomyces sp. NPDC059374]
MTRTVRLCGSAGCDGSRESRAAAAWAAREAGLLRLPPGTPRGRVPPRCTGHPPARGPNPPPPHKPAPDPPLRP